MAKLRYEIPDYEHRGDLRFGENYVKKLCPQANILSSYQERDYERESDFRSEYGYLDEYLYRGFVEFEVPDDKVLLFKSCSSCFKVI